MSILAPLKPPSFRRSGPYGSRHDMGPEVSYAAAITELDRQLGLVLEALETASEAECTAASIASLDTGCRRSTK